MAIASGAMPQLPITINGEAVEVSSTLQAVEEAVASTSSKANR
jgi:hypothetical protein